MFVKKLVEKAAKKVQNLKSNYSIRLFCFSPTVHLLLLRLGFSDSVKKVSSSLSDSCFSNFFFIKFRNSEVLPKSMLDPFVRIIFDFFLLGLIILYIFLWLRYYKCVLGCDLVIKLAILSD